MCRNYSSDERINADNLHKLYSLKISEKKDSDSEECGCNSNSVYTSCDSKFVYKDSVEKKHVEMMEKESLSEYKSSKIKYIETRVKQGSDDSYLGKTGPMKSNIGKKTTNLRHNPKLTKRKSKLFKQLEIESNCNLSEFLSDNRFEDDSSNIQESQNTGTLLSILIFISLFQPRFRSSLYHGF